MCQFDVLIFITIFAVSDQFLMFVILYAINVLGFCGFDFKCQFYVKYCNINFDAFQPKDFAQKRLLLTLEV